VLLSHKELLLYLGDSGVEQGDLLAQLTVGSKECGSVSGHRCIDISRDTSVKFLHGIGGNKLKVSAHSSMLRAEREWHLQGIERRQISSIANGLSPGHMLGVSGVLEVHFFHDFLVDLVVSFTVRLRVALDAGALDR